LLFAGFSQHWKYPVWYAAQVWPLPECYLTE
jgi:hypothetical protein